MTADSIRFHDVVAAAYDPVQRYFERFQAPEHRRYLAADLSGSVLEVGVGTGAMGPYYAAEVDAETRLYGVEPDPGMWRQADDKLAAHDVEMDLVCGRVESLPYPDDSFEYVLECGLFCSVPDIDRALGEMARVLKPGGELRFFDHVRSGGTVGRTQDWLTPLWRKIGGNCHLNRELRPVLEASDRFVVTEVAHHTVGYWPIREFVRGRAKPATP